MEYEGIILLRVGVVDVHDDGSVEREAGAYVDKSGNKYIVLTDSNGTKVMENPSEELFNEIAIEAKNAAKREEAVKVYKRVQLELTPISYV
ncbi:MAG: hypothetical protein BWY28_02223 [bacterium ADurb.Bin236]|nr:MAG: hypothetical protein BWY28_02223 [bacterium ADurb.Bin236]HOY62323.1 hypothetical protein [bacterium]HPN94745.1 hypothetical protein [bacterium]